MNDHLAIVEHGDTSRMRYLRRNRLRIALITAAIEGVLVFAGVIPWWLVLLLTGAAVALYLWVRSDSFPAGRQLAWIAAVSQLIVVLVPVAAAILTALAIGFLVLLAVVALAVLLRDRR